MTLKRQLWIKLGAPGRSTFHEGINKINVNMHSDSKQCLQYGALSGGQFYLKRKIILLQDGA